MRSRTAAPGFADADASKGRAHHQIQPSAINLPAIRKMTRNMPAIPDRASEHEAEASKQDGAAYPEPLLRLEVLDLANKGAVAFLQTTNASEALHSAVRIVLNTLYPGHSSSAAAAPPRRRPAQAPWPGTRSVTLVVDPYQDGVAYTTGKHLDSDHKEIHLMTGYVQAVPVERQAHEIRGVLVHEMVHCWQWAAGGKANGGLIEGVADWVRLKAGLAPPHWKRRHGKDDAWDSGYAITAYFLDWLDDKFGDGTVVALNAKLADGDEEYSDDGLFKAVVGRTVASLWEEYVHGAGKLDE